MKRFTTAVLAAALLSAAASAPAMAVKNGNLDGNDHPQVGLMVAKDDAGKPLWRCSGTLISATVFLTAGHCTETPAVSAEIWFAADMQNGADAKRYPTDGDVSGQTYTHPQYRPAAFYLYDLGVVVLDEPVSLKEYGKLPALDQLDKLKAPKVKAKTTFTSVGYGMQRSFPDAASWKDVADKVRMVAHPRLLQINGGIAGRDSLLLSNNTATGGTCFGDSGGPNFLNDSLIVAGVTSFGMNGTCSGTGGVYRVDRADDLDWLAAFLKDG